MRRVLAVLAAVAMVAVSLFVRARLDDGDDGSGGDRNGGTEADDGTFRVVCATELADVCQGLSGEVTVEDVPVTADRLAEDDDPGIDAWVAPSPWPEMVDEARAQAGLPALFGDDVQVLARSRLVVVGGDELGGCDWRCIGERTGGGELDLGWSDPASGFGLLAVGAATGGFFAGDLDAEDIATNDFDGAFDAFLRGLVDGATVDDAPVERILQSGAFFDAAVSYEAEAVPQVEAAGDTRRGDLDVLYPEPVASVDVVLASVGDPVGDDELRTALVEAGWDPPSGGDSGLPNAGVMRALREEVS